MINQQHPPVDHFRPTTFRDFTKIVKGLEDAAIIEIKPLTKKTATLMNQNEANENQIGPNPSAAKKVKPSLDPDCDYDEDAATTVVCLTGHVDADDVKHALVEAAVDPVALKYLQL